MSHLDELMDNRSSGVSDSALLAIAAGNVDALRLKLVEIGEARDKFDERAAHWHTEWFKADVDRTSLRHQLEESRKDSERLDWLEANPFTVSPSKDGDMPVEYHIRSLANYYRNLPRPTIGLRKAIDRAVGRKSTK